MTESFWFLAGEDDVERPAASSLSSTPYDDFQPVSEPMRGRERKLQRAPSTDEKRVKRQIHRSGVLAAWETIPGHAHERQTDWDQLYKEWEPHKDRIRVHRAMTLYGVGDLYDKLNDPSVPKHEKSEAILDHLRTNGRDMGRHWSTSEDHAKRVGFYGGWSAIGNNESEKEENQFDIPISAIVHAKLPEKHHIETDPKVLEEHHVTPWGGSEHYEDEEEIPLKPGTPVQVTGVSWSTKSGPRSGEWETHRYDTDVEAQEKREKAERQQRMDDFHRSRPAEGRNLSHGFAVHLPRAVHQRLIDPSVPVEDRAGELVEHVKQQGVKWENKDDPHGGGKAHDLMMEHHEPVIQGNVYGKTPSGTTEYDVRNGYKDMGPAPITGLYWHETSPPETGAERAPSHKHQFGPGTAHTATVLNTQIERLNKGDRIRTPTGQSAEVKGVRPHETDSTLIYLDTDMGTSTVKRGTDFQTVPYNAQQQELPDTGNPMGSGNTAQLPGTAHGPGGPTSGSAPTAATVCPNCGNSGTLHLQGENYVCSVCGYTISAKGSPGGLTFTNQPKGYLPGRRKPGEIPRAHVWAAKYTDRTESQLARRVRQVLGGDQ